MSASKVACCGGKSCACWDTHSCQCDFRNQQVHTTGDASVARKCGSHSTRRGPGKELSYVQLNNMADVIMQDLTDIICRSIATLCQRYKKMSRAVPSMLPGCPQFCSL